ncbi:hypothetical protein VTL71DRAFT_14199 [Oculimacula yallundae]|uniref:RNA ligase domain-containing protein n=1 Tax=Oculimacula yallundae TaxID=86028 RepID=A0ABR4CIG7_9HELO
MAHLDIPSPNYLTENPLTSRLEIPNQIDLPTPPITPQLDKNALASLPENPSLDGAGIEIKRGRVAVLKITDTSNDSGGSSSSTYKAPTTKSIFGPGFSANKQRLGSEDLGVGIANTNIAAHGAASKPPTGNAPRPPNNYGGSDTKKSRSKAKAKKAVVKPTLPPSVTIPEAFITLLANTKVKTLFPKITGDIKLIESRYRVDHRKPIPGHTLNLLRDNVPRIIEFFGTVKLHAYSGQHADIIINHDNTIRLQSRNLAVLNGKQDIMGFATTMFSLEKNLLELKIRIESRWIEINRTSSLSKTHPLIIAGEWVGPGVQKNVAIELLPRRLFVITSISLNNIWLDDQLYCDIEDFEAGIVNVARGGFFKEQLHVTDLKCFEERTMALTLEIEKKCPFAQHFGIIGRGEGIVWKAAHPLGKDPRMWIKSKGPDFAVIKTDQLPVPMPKAIANVEAMIERTRQFAYATTTEPRLQQMWNVLKLEHLLPMDKKNMKKFMQWVADDILLEEKRRMKECNVDRLYLEKCIRWMAEIWYEQRLNEYEKLQASHSALKTAQVEGNVMGFAGQDIQMQPETEGIEVTAAKGGTISERAKRTNGGRGQHKLFTTQLIYIRTLARLTWSGYRGGGFLNGGVARILALGSGAGRGGHGGG